MQPRPLQMPSSRDQQVVLERERGDTLVEIGRRHGISHQRVSVLIARATDFVNRVDLDLMIAGKTDELVAYIVPFGPDYSQAIEFGQWLVDRLRDRGMVVDIETRRTTNGLILFLTDATPRKARA
jgi:hypothetical protein